MFWKIYIYGARAIFLLFCDHQDTESESHEIEISIYQPIFTQKYSTNALWDNIAYTLQDKGKCCGSFSYLWSLIHVPTILGSSRH